MGLPVLEIDLRAFTPEAFSPDAVKQAVLDSVDGKEWLWPRPEEFAPEIQVAPQSRRTSRPVNCLRHGDQKNL